jgi:hypothetical protein
MFKEGGLREIVLGRMVLQLVTSLGRVTSRGLTGVILLTVVILVGGAFAGDRAALDAQEYSAYSDPEKPVLSFILSEQQNVEELKADFGLSDGEVEAVLAAIRKENRALAREYGQSEQIVASNKELPKEEIAGKIAASDYDETVVSAVEETKDGISALLPEAERDRLAAWVDEHWRQEVAEASEDDSGRVVESKGRRTLVCDRIFATQYNGYTRFEAALPHRGLKFGDRPEVPIKRGKRSIRPRVKEVGPWNTYDNYWRSGNDRDMWRNLARCKPEAQAAYYNDYNNGKDEFGRKVLNPAGVDLTPAAARRLGLDRYQNAWVAVRFPWVR